MTISYEKKNNYHCDLNGIFLQGVFTLGLTHPFVSSSLPPWLCLSLSVPVCQSVGLYLCLCLCQSVCLSVCQSASLSLPLPVCQSVSLSLSLPVCQSVRLYLCLCLCLCVCVCVSPPPPPLEVLHDLRQNYCDRISCLRL